MYYALKKLALISAITASTLSFPSLSDTFTGSKSADVINGTIHNDTIDALKGADTIFGDAGDDDINGGYGDDIINGGMGNDTIIGNRGHDEIKGNEGDDTLKGGKGNDKIFGNDGSDILQGNKGNDTLSGGAGNDKLFGHEGNDILIGGAGNDKLQGGSGTSTMSGEEGNDNYIIIDSIIVDNIEDATVKVDSTIIDRSGKNKLVYLGEDLSNTVLSLVNGVDLHIQFRNKNTVLIKDQYLDDQYTISTINNIDIAMSFEALVAAGDFTQYAIQDDNYDINDIHLTLINGSDLQVKFGADKSMYFAQQYPNNNAESVLISVNGINTDSAFESLINNAAFKYFTLSGTYDDLGELIIPSDVELIITGNYTTPNSFTNDGVVIIAPSAMFYTQKEFLNNHRIDLNGELIIQYSPFEFWQAPRNDGTISGLGTLNNQGLFSWNGDIDISTILNNGILLVIDFDQPYDVEVINSGSFFADHGDAAFIDANIKNIKIVSEFVDHFSARDGWNIVSGFMSGPLKSMSGISSPPTELQNLVYKVELSLDTQSNLETDHHIEGLTLDQSRGIQIGSNVSIQIDFNGFDISDFTGQSFEFISDSAQCEIEGCPSILVPNGWIGTWVESFNGQSFVITPQN